MVYKIIIERREPNPNFETELNEWKEQNKFNLNSRMGDRFNDNYPQDVKITNALICELTEEEYKKIKAEVFTTFS